MAGESEASASGIGERVARIRARRGLTQEDLAERCGVNVSTIRKLEQGGRATCALDTLNRLARGLSVTTSDLFRPIPRFDARPPDERERADLLAIRQALFPLRGLPGLVTSDGVDAPSLAGARASLRAAAVLLHRDRYVDAMAVLPSLITEARAAAEQSDVQQRRAAFDLLAESYQLGASLLTHLRHEDLASHALDLSMNAAECSGNRLVAANAVVTQGWVLIRQGRFAEAERISVATADAIEPRLRDANRFELSTWGWLLLRASAAAARDARATESDDLLRFARAAAQAAGEDQHDQGRYWPAFGPVTVAMKAVENAMVGGRPGEALALAAAVPLQGRPTSNNRNRFLLDQAHALVWQRQHAASLEILLDIRAQAPEWLKRQHYARRIMALVLRGRKRVLTREIRDLCDFLQLDILA